MSIDAAITLKLLTSCGALSGCNVTLPASVFRYGKYTIRQAKEYLQRRGVEVRF